MTPVAASRAALCIPATGAVVLLMGVLLSPDNSLPRFRLPGCRRGSRSGWNASPALKKSRLFWKADFSFFFLSEMVNHELKMRLEFLCCRATLRRNNKRLDGSGFLQTLVSSDFHRISHQPQLLSDVNLNCQAAQTLHIPTGGAGRATGPIYTKAIGHPCCCHSNCGLLRR